MIYSVEQFRDWPVTCGIRGRWVLARPLAGPWEHRWRAAWGVLTGRYDAISWVQTEENRKAGA